MAWHLAVNEISRSRICGQDHVGRSSVMFRKDEFRTPSPLLPSWHRGELFESAAMDEESNDDCYFHSSENIGSYLQQPRVKSSMNCGSDNGSLNGNQAVPLEVLDNHYLRRITPELPDSCGFGSRFNRTVRTLDERTCTETQFSKSRGLAVDRRSKCILHCAHFVVILWGFLAGVPLCIATFVCIS